MSAFSPRFILIAVLLFMLVNFPLLSIADKNILIAGMPLLFVYLGGVWILGIVLLFMTSRRLPDERE